MFVCMYAQLPGATWHLRSTRLYRIYTCYQCTYIHMHMCTYSFDNKHHHLLHIYLECTQNHSSAVNALDNHFLTRIYIRIHMYLIYVIVCMSIGFAYQFPTPADQFNIWVWVLFLEHRFVHCSKFTYTNIYLKAFGELSRNPSLFPSIFADNPNNHTYMYVCLFVSIIPTCIHTYTYRLIARSTFCVVLEARRRFNIPLPDSIPILAFHSKRLILVLYYYIR